MNTMEYKGYIGSTEVDVDAGAVVGRLLFIRDTITYSSADVRGLRKAFEEAVDDYLATCQELGDEPDTPCKGTFNVRVGPQRHLAAAMEARKLGISLNDYVCQALDAARLPRHEHNNHTHIGEVHVQLAQDHVPLIASTAGSKDMSFHRATTH